ncbi:response regulator receiver protein [Paraburkholderia sp. BL18I3N2]|uniref:helix-turn-helix domain-containing protein n=1 Tax=unclassified Paraburkholderia TaxID=2615204 RepID=UPI000D444D96|nr:MULTISPECIES: helix-turn-helix domain-containing protein [unclassified Paraburkholderia]PRX23994.1 response regulator receiver protein [Paraburkholderia sp. BL18I3N2]PRX95972.1 response regulator receiver protein [Paraburkholderia sp. BL25I1N1]
MPDNDIQTDSMAIASRVRNLMERHGVTKRAQASELSRILNLSFSAASRKMKGQLPWDLKQLGAVATHFGETPSVLVESNEGFEDSIAGEGMLMVSPRPLPCSVWIGAELSGDRSADLVAIQSGNAWNIYPAEIAPAGRIFNVLSVEIRPNLPHLEKPAIAVLDDDTETQAANNVCDYLNDHGLNATPFYDLASFRESLKSNAFDAFIIDWLVNDDTAEAAILDIRKAENATAPIYLLTGQLQSGKARVDDIARVIKQFGCKWIEKPVRMPILFSEISHELSRSSS